MTGRCPPTTNPGARAWFKDRDAFSRSYWEKQYAGLADELHACCVKQFDHCLQAAQEQFARQGKPAPGAVEACVQRWSPEHQTAAAAAPQTPLPAPDSLAAAQQAMERLGQGSGSTEPAAGAPAAENPCATADRRAGEQAYQALAAERDGIRQQWTRCQKITDEMARTLAELRQ